MNPFSLLSKGKYIAEDAEIQGAKKRRRLPSANFPSAFDRLHQESPSIGRYGNNRRILKEIEKAISETNPEKGPTNLVQVQVRKQGYRSFSTRRNSDQDRNSEEHQFQRKENVFPPDAFKLKKDTAREFVQRKKEVFIKNLNISVKNEAIDHLSDYLESKEEGLNTAIADMRNDAKMVNFFIQKLEEDVNAIREVVKKLDKKKQKKQLKLNKLKTETNTIQQQTGMIDEDIKELSMFQEFIYEIANYAGMFEKQKKPPEEPSPDLKSESTRERKNLVNSKQTGNNSVIFLTATDQPKNNKEIAGRNKREKGKAVAIKETRESPEEALARSKEEKIREIMKRPEHFAEVLEKIEEENFKIIEQTQLTNEEMKNLNNILEKMSQEHKRKAEEIAALTQEAKTQKEELEKELVAKRNLNKSFLESQGSFQINDSAKGLDPAAMCEKVKEIFNYLFPDKRYKKDIQDLDRIEAIEKEFEKYRNKEKDYLKFNPSDYTEIQSMYIETLKHQANEKARKKKDMEMERVAKIQRARLEKKVDREPGRKDVFSHRFKTKNQRLEEIKLAVDIQNIEEERFFNWGGVDKGEQQKYFDELKRESMNKSRRGASLENSAGMESKKPRNTQSQFKETFN